MDAYYTVNKFSNKEPPTGSHTITDYVAIRSRQKPRRGKPEYDSAMFRVRCWTVVGTSRFYQHYMHRVYISGGVDEYMAKYIAPLPRYRLKEYTWKLTRCMHKSTNYSEMVLRMLALPRTGDKYGEVECDRLSPSLFWSVASLSNMENRPIDEHFTVKNMVLHSFKREENCPKHLALLLAEAHNISITIRHGVGKRAATSYFNMEATSGRIFKLVLHEGVYYPIFDIECISKDHKDYVYGMCKPSHFGIDVVVNNTVELLRELENSKFLDSYKPTWEEELKYSWTRLNFLRKNTDRYKQEHRSRYKFVD